MERITKCHRQKMRPKDPVSIDFEVDEENIQPDFFKSDILNQTRRHLLLLTNQQLTLLSNARRWYIDASFK
jgi:hypothetical protein